MRGTAKPSQASMLWAYVHSGKIDPAKVTDLLEAALTEARAQGAAEERERLAKLADDQCAKITGSTPQSRRDALAAACWLRTLTEGTTP